MAEPRKIEQRGDLVDREARYSALPEGRIAGIGTDVHRMVDRILPAMRTPGACGSIEISETGLAVPEKRGYVCLSHIWIEHDEPFQMR